MNMGNISLLQKKNMAKETISDYTEVAQVTLYMRSCFFLTLLRFSLCL